MNALTKLFATALGAGYSPVAPGTCGTAVAVPLVWALASLPMWQFAVIAALITAFAIAVAHRADRIWASHDSQRIVIDEVAGYCITMIPVARDHWATLAVGFVVFRFFDIVKPPPIRWLDQNLPGGWGVVLDDAAAGVMGALVMIGLAELGVFIALANL
ncbi:MAG: phosphatidylglycerophosphatase A [Deltaproteobacteria bacterium]|nr:phosphatidylglycerophosphatase A [Deltaproteobacteria bacterium]MDQ3300696.1 phosphatidylglycerophosphatase A [Myxococcota bacterium]